MTALIRTDVGSTWYPQCFQSAACGSACSWCGSRACNCPIQKQLIMQLWQAKFLTHCISTCPISKACSACTNSYTSVNICTIQDFGNRGHSLVQFCSPAVRWHHCCIACLGRRGHTQENVMLTDLLGVGPILILPTLVLLEVSNEVFNELRHGTSYAGSRSSGPDQAAETPKQQRNRQCHLN